MTQLHVGNKHNTSFLNHHQQKNKPGSIVVIYDECENIAPSVATTLVQRGYDNLFMLSGGTSTSASGVGQYEDKYQ